MLQLARVLILGAVFFAALSFAWAGGATAYLLPAQRFQGWTNLYNTCTDTLIHQEWKTPITDIPQEASGYVLVAYQAEKTDSPATATQRMAAILAKSRFQSYLAKGYTVNTTPWEVMGQRGVQFTVTGTAYTPQSSRANHAEVYALAFTRESWVVWLETRESGSGTDLKQAGDVVRKGGARALATDLTALMPALWAAQAAPDPEPITVTPGGIDPPPGQEGVIIAVPVEPVEPATPVGTTPPVTPEDPSPTPPTPAERDPKRWYTPDGHLSLLLPPGWKAAGETPVVISGMPEGEIRLYPAENYKEAAGHDQALKEFTATQRAVSAGQFSAQSVTVGGAPGVCVRYRNYLNHTVLAWYFGAGGRLWRLETEIPGDNAPVPLGLSVLLYAVRVE